MMEEIDQLVDQKRAELQQTFFQKHEQLITVTEVFRQTLEACKNRGWDTHAQLWNVGIYINIAAHDLSILVMQVHFERDAWTRKQIARHVVLTIYEVIEDMTQLLGKRIRAPLETHPPPTGFDTNHPNFLPNAAARAARGGGECDCKWQLIKGKLRCSPDGRQRHSYTATWRCPSNKTEVITVRYAPPTAPCK